MKFKFLTELQGVTIRKKKARVKKGKQKLKNIYLSSTKGKEIFCLVYLIVMRRGRIKFQKLKIIVVSN